MSAERSMLHRIQVEHRRAVMRVQEEEAEADLRNYKMGIDGGSSSIPLERVIFKSVDPKEHKIPDDSVATPEDIKARREDQFSSFLERESVGELTPEWRRFGQRHMEEIEVFNRR